MQTYYYFVRILMESFFTTETLRTQRHPNYIFLSTFFYLQTGGFFEYNFSIFVLLKNKFNN